MVKKILLGLALIVAVLPGSGEAQSLRVNISGSGSGKVSGKGIDCPQDCQETYAPPLKARLPGGLPATVITLTATPDAGNRSRFQRWDAGCASATGPTCTLTVVRSPNGNPQLVTAVFAGPVTVPRELNVTVAGQGKVKGAGIDCPGACYARSPETPLVLVAEAAAGHHFAAWTGSCTGTEPRCSKAGGVIGIVAARFEANPPSEITIAVEGSGRVTGAGISCPTDCTEQISAPVTLTAVTEEGHQFMGWSEPCRPNKDTPVNQNPSLTCSVPNTGSPLTVTATFK